MSDPAAAPIDGPPPSASQLFLAFAQIALSGFGGVLAWARRVIVDERGWLGPQAFNELLALCQVLPGPNIVNFSIMFGSRSAGIPGALAAFSGLVGPPVILMITAGVLYRHYGEAPALQGVLAGLAAAAAGVIIATSAQMAQAMVRPRLRPGHIVAVVTFVAAGILRLPLLWVMAVLVPISIAFAWWERR